MPFILITYVISTNNHRVSVSVSTSFTVSLINAKYRSILGGGGSFLSGCSRKDDLLSSQLGRYVRDYCYLSSATVNHMVVKAYYCASSSRRQCWCRDDGNCGVTNVMWRFLWQISGLSLREKNRCVMISHQTWIGQGIDMMLLPLPICSGAL